MLRVFENAAAGRSAGTDIVPTVAFALAAAAAYGLGAVLQHHAAISEATEPTATSSLLVRLVRRPLWLAGNALDAVGYVFQFLALRTGSLTLVEPLLVLSLVFALPVSASIEHRRVTLVDLSSTAVVIGGLALFLGVGRPGIGHPHASAGAWAVLSVIVAAGCGATILAARRAGGGRAVIFAAGSGLAFGYVAAVTERTGHLLDHGIVHALSSWEPYALVGAASLALWLTQSAFHAGELRLSLPMLTVAQPLVAVAIGLGLFGEHLKSRGIAPFVEATGLVLMTIGVFLLARSPLIDVRESPPAP